MSSRRRNRSSTPPSSSPGRSSGAGAAGASRSSSSPQAAGPGDAPGRDRGSDVFADRSASGSIYDGDSLLRAAVPIGEPLSRLHLWEIQGLRDAAVILGIVLLVLCGYWLRSVTVPLLIAAALAYLVEPVVQRLTQRLEMSRSGVVGGLVALVGVLTAVVMLAILPLLVVQAFEFFRTLPDIVERIVLKIEDIVPPDLMPAEFQTLLSGNPSETIRAWVTSNFGSIFQVTVDTTGDALGIIIGMLGSVIYFAFLLFLIPFYFYFFSVSLPSSVRFVEQLLPRRSEARIRDLAEKMDRAVSGFVRGRIVISAIMGILLAIGWGIVGVPYWLIVGLTTGVLCAVPYLGGLGIPAAIILLWLAQGQAPPDAALAWWQIILWPSVVFFVVQLIEGYVLVPVIAGRSTNLGPVSILVAVLAGGVVGGVYGMLLAIPVAACLKIVITEVFLPRVRDWAEGRAEDILPIARD